MVACGRVQNGGGVLDNGVRWPEGQEVTVNTIIAPTLAWKVPQDTARSPMDELPSFPALA
jgi:hypothetical protein